jgi:hypothetical protein
VWAGAENEVIKNISIVLVSINSRYLSRKQVKQQVGTYLMVRLYSVWYMCSLIVIFSFGRSKYQK